MNKQIGKLKNFRIFILKHLEGLTTQQLNTIPDGYKNNIIWNVAHLTCAQQSLCYFRAGLPIVVDEKYFAPYAPGTMPDRWIEEPEIETIKALSLSSIDRLQEDFEKEVFGNYSPSARILEVYGVEVNNIHDALDFLLYHEGFHSAYIMALKHLV